MFQKIVESYSGQRFFSGMEFAVVLYLKVDVVNQPTFLEAGMHHLYLRQETQAGRVILLERCKNKF